jgi:predicted DNA-binding transcriptional regulator AlpA
MITVKTMQLLSWKQLAKRASVSVSTAKRLRRDDPEFPRKIKISPGRVGFDEAEANAWLAELIRREVEVYRKEWFGCMIDIDDPGQLGGLLADLERLAGRALS